MMMVFNARIDILRACAQSFCYHKPGFEILFSCLSIMLRLVLNNCYNGTVKFEVREQSRADFGRGYETEILPLTERDT